MSRKSIFLVLIFLMSLVGTLAYVRKYAFEISAWEYDDVARLVRDHPELKPHVRRAAADDCITRTEWDAIKLVIAKEKLRRSL